MPSKKPTPEPRPDTGDVTPPHGEILNEDRNASRPEPPPADDEKERDRPPH
jgi:hypothetical protein